MSSKPTAEKIEKPTVKVVQPSYQPSRKELRQDLRINATFEEVIKGMVAPVKIEYVKSPKELA